MKFFLIKRTQSWLNLAHVVSVYKQGDGYSVALDNGKTYSLNENEYKELTDLLSEKTQTPPKADELSE